MAFQETEGIILKTYVLADADKIAVIYTRDYGLMRGVARGVKRLKSRFGSSLEFLTVIKFSFFQKDQQELATLGEIEIVKSYFDLLKNENFYNRMAYLSQLIVDFMPANQADENVYRLLNSCLRAASGNLDKTNELTLYFEIWLLRFGGFLMDWEECYLCRRNLTFAEFANLHIDNHLICRSCHPRKTQFEITPDQRNLVRQIKKISPEDFAKIKEIDESDVIFLTEIFRRQIAAILGRVATEKLISSKTV